MKNFIPERKTFKKLMSNFVKIFVINIDKINFFDGNFAFRCFYEIFHPFFLFLSFSKNGEIIHKNKEKNTHEHKILN